MSALDEFADNVNDIVASHNARFQKLNDAKRALQVKGNDIADRWEQYFTEEAKKLQVANDALNRISNAPLSGTSVKPPNSGALSTIPKVVPGV